MTNRTIWLLIPAKVSLKRAETEQLFQVKRMIGGIGDMLFSICSQTENVFDPTNCFFGEPLWGQVRTPRELFWVIRTGDDPPCVDSKTPPCVHTKRTRVYRHLAHMLKHMCAWCWHTRGRFEPHTGFSTFLQRAATHTHTHHTPNTHTHTPNTHHDRNDTHTHTTQRNITRRQR